MKIMSRICSDTTFEDLDGMMRDIDGTIADFEASFRKSNDDI